VGRTICAAHSGGRMEQCAAAAEGGTGKDNGEDGEAEQAEKTAQPKTWFDGSRVNDVLFCEDFLAGHPMKKPCTHGLHTTVGSLTLTAQSAIRSRLRRRYTI